MKEKEYIFTPGSFGYSSPLWKFINNIRCERFKKQLEEASGVLKAKKEPGQVEVQCTGVGPDGTPCPVLAGLVIQKSKWGKDSFKRGGRRDKDKKCIRKK